jgi:hypothetical protein
MPPTKRENQDLHKQHHFDFGYNRLNRLNISGYRAVPPSNRYPQGVGPRVHLELQTRAIEPHYSPFATKKTVRIILGNIPVKLPELRGQNTTLVVDTPEEFRIVSRVHALNLTGRKHGYKTILNWVLDFILPDEK